MKVTLKGTEELKKTLSRIPVAAKAEATKAVEKVTSDLLGESKRRAPIDVGDLRGTAFSPPVRQNARTGNPEGMVIFPVIYAMYQHEGIHFQHPRGGEAKYVERPLKERRDLYVKYIKEAIKKGVQK